MGAAYAKTLVSTRRCMARAPNAVFEFTGKRHEGLTYWILEYQPRKEKEHRIFSAEPIKR